ncbi:hypothetical protein ISCGN_005649 [Ixodes scapularis]
MLNCAAAWHVLGYARQWARSFENVTCVTQPALLLLYVPSHDALAAERVDMSATARAGPGCAGTIRVWDTPPRGTSGQVSRPATTSRKARWRNRSLKRLEKASPYLRRGLTSYCGRVQKNDVNFSSGKKKKNYRYVVLVSGWKFWGNIVDTA